MSKISIGNAKNMNILNHNVDEIGATVTVVIHQPSHVNFCYVLGIMTNRQVIPVKINNDDGYIKFDGSITEYEYDGENVYLDIKMNSQIFTVPKPDENTIELEGIVSNIDFEALLNQLIEQGYIQLRGGQKSDGTWYIKGLRL